MEYESENWQGLLESANKMNQSYLPSEYIEAWSKTKVALESLATKKINEQEENRIREINEFSQQARNACMQNESVTSLEHLLVKGASLEMKNRRHKNTSQARGQDKLRGSMETLAIWLEYLDFTQKERFASARKSLEQLLRSNEYPLLSTSEIQSKISQLPINADASDARALLVNKLDSVRTPEELKPLISEIELVIGTQGSYKGWGYSSAKQFDDSFEAFKAGDHISTQIYLQSSSASASLPSALKNLIQMLANDFLDSEIQKISPEFRKSEDEPMTVFLEKLIKKQIESEDWEMVKRTLDLFSIALYPNRRQPSWLYSDKAIVNGLIVARRFKASGDDALALVELRSILSITGSKLAPISLAEKELLDLKEGEPNLVSDDLSVILSELQALRKEISSNTRSTRLRDR
ncbi:MAG: hypothetical protein AAF212_02805 [Verrucomicrobiota bacterium]